MESRGPFRSKSLGSVKDKITRTLRSAAKSSTPSVRGFRSSLLSSLRDLQVTSKQMDEDDGVPGRDEKSRQSRVKSAYHRLRGLYSTNPELVDSMARNLQRGKPGAQWMGLRRDDVPRLLRLLEENFRTEDLSVAEGRFEREIKSEADKNPLMTLTASLEQIAVADKERIGLEVCAKAIKIPANPGDVDALMSPGGRLRVSRLLPLHIPGPERLHQNVCIRRYSEGEDGRREEVKWRKSEGHVEEAGGGGESSLKVEGGKEKEEGDGGGDEEVEEGLTIESFLPFFNVTR